jgi:hypothetical protein
MRTDAVHARKIRELTAYSPVTPLPSPPPMPPRPAARWVPLCCLVRGRTRPPAGAFAGMAGEETDASPRSSEEMTERRRADGELSYRGGDGGGGKQD